MYPNPYRNDLYYEPPEIKTTAAYKADGLQERVTVPSLRAVIVAVPAGLLAGLLIGVFKIEVNVWYAIPITILITFLFVFWGSSQRGQWLIEKIAGADLNKDGFIGRPEPPAPAESVRIELIQDQGRKGDYIDLPYPDKLPALAAGLLAGRTFNQTAWTGRVGIFSRSEFDQVRDTLIERGLACWKNPEARAQGVELTGAGRAVMRRLAAHPTTLPDEIGR